MTETVDTATGEIAVPATTQMSLWQEGSFSSLVEGADFVEGYRLATKAELVGKPFVITAVHFYPGAGSDFVAVSAVTMDNEPIVFNDGSTGVRRQIVAYLASKGRIDPGPGEEAAEAGKSRYDRPAAEWKAPKGAEKIGKDEGFDVRLVAPRGLRISEYEWKPGQVAETYYLG